VRVNLLLSRIQPELRITVDAHRSASLLQNILRALRIILLVGSNSRNLPVLPINHIVIGVCVELDLSLSNLRFHFLVVLVLLLVILARVIVVILAVDRVVGSTVNTSFANKVFFPFYLDLISLFQFLLLHGFPAAHVLLVTLISLMFNLLELFI